MKENGQLCIYQKMQMIQRKTPTNKIDVLFLISSNCLATQPLLTLLALCVKK